MITCCLGLRRPRGCQSSVTCFWTKLQHERSTQALSATISCPSFFLLKRSPSAWSKHATWVLSRFTTESSSAYASLGLRLVQVFGVRAWRRLSKQISVFGRSLPTFAIFTNGLWIMLCTRSRRSGRSFLLCLLQGLLCPSCPLRLTSTAPFAHEVVAAKVEVARKVARTAGAGPIQAKVRGRSLLRFQGASGLARSTRQVRRRPSACVFRLRKAATMQIASTCTSAQCLPLRAAHAAVSALHSAIRPLLTGELRWCLALPPCKVNQVR